MNAKIKVAASFKRQAKKLFKKYPSLKKELRQLEKDLKRNPELGTPLGQKAYKIRLKITSKGKGKSGGARVITYIETVIIELVEQEKTVNLIAIYDKSETETITTKNLRELIRNI